MTRFLAVVVVLAFASTADAQIRRQVQCADGSCNLQTSPSTTYIVNGRAYSEAEFIKAFNVVQIGSKPATAPVAVAPAPAPIFTEVWTKKKSRIWHKN